MDIVDPVACCRGLYLPRLYVMLSSLADVADAIDECPLAVVGPTVANTDVTNSICSNLR